MKNKIKAALITFLIFLAVVIFIYASHLYPKIIPIISLVLGALVCLYLIYIAIIKNLEQ